MTCLIRYQPLVGRGNGLFDDFFHHAYLWEAGGPQTAPIRFDVRETDAAYVVAADLPGAKKEDIDIKIEGNEVTISAETKREVEQKEAEKWLRTERHYGKIARRFALPQEVDEAKAEAKFADGVLELTLPKKAAVTGRKIAVQ